MTVSGILIDSSELQPENTSVAIVKTLEGIIIFFMEEHSENILQLMSCTYFGNLTSANDLHPLNTLLPMVTTESGKIIVFSDVQP